jgi:anti-sigma factor RsiW
VTCRELIEFLDDYVAGDLSEEQLRTFDEHLGICPDCVSYLESYRRTIGLERASYGIPDDDVPEEVPQRLIEAILAVRKTSDGSK